MKNLKSAVVILLGLLAAAFPVMAQDDGAAACGIVGCGIFVYLLFIALMIGVAVVVVVLIFKFIKRDTIARGDNPNKAWFALLGLLGLLIYVLTRPQGNVMPCPSCGQSRMQGLPRCPHCGNP